MESENSTSSSSGELQEEGNLPLTYNLASVGHRFDGVPSPRVIPAHPPEDSEIEENESISIAAIENDEAWIINVHVNLEPHPVLCCIYKVPGPLRNVKPEAYTPKVMSIGPLHYGRVRYGMGGMHKIRYKRKFDNRITPEKWQQLVNFIQANEKRIRDSYEQNYAPDKLRVISMILYDAVFIIELFLHIIKRKVIFC